ncbi:hypothetical protein ASPBRDRAFT_54667 [Aspergillus brasiliensis CBS 101740]|uniref:Uncharacterized protein n=1 Tax=Aspergillus brasiliensis (strain CBS 101740 / IMI 381727 / IBT 21946) TaxID=767769 RepID=A0A1L9UME4_ASPBC|nr:hypothetical protein ASPBRDRAFT_54667 [Aspergillus brasiliensis CBS 101740]
MRVRVSGIHLSARSNLVSRHTLHVGGRRQLVLISNANTPDENKCCEPTVASKDSTIPSFEQDNKQVLTRTRMVCRFEIKGLPRQSSLGHHFRNAASLPTQGGAKFRGIQDVRTHVQLVDPDGLLKISLADSSSNLS